MFYRSVVSVSPARSHRKQESIYDYLDALETQSERQLHSTCGSRSGLGSIGDRSTADSVRSIELRDGSKRHPTSHARDYAWESDGGGSEFDAHAPRSSGASPAPSYRSGVSRGNSDASHQYYVGIKEKLATMTIELNVRQLSILALYNESVLAERHVCMCCAIGQDQDDRVAQDGTQEGPHEDQAARGG